MKIAEKSKEKNKKNKKNQVDKPQKDHVLIVAQEIKFARLLSGNEKKIRDRVLKTFKKWLVNCFQKGYEFKEDDFVRVWKGLFYAVWMSDKPLVQEDLCESIAGILDQFPSEHFQHGLLMVKAGFKVLATEWYGIDHHRMDKYLMLVRRYLRGSFRCLHRTGWNLESCQMYSKMLMNPDGLLSLKAPHYARNALSMVMHIVDCFLEELSKVSEGEIPEDSLVELLRPFCGYTTGGEVPTLCVATRRLLTALVRQSELGLQYREATSAWQKMGCPEGGPEALELVSDDEEGDNELQNSDDMDTPEEPDVAPREKALDPRAGRVDVMLHPLPVPAGKLADMLREMLTQASSKAHKRVKICMERFEKLAREEYPLPVAQSDIVRDSGPRVSAQRSLKSLKALEKNLVAASDDLALRGLNRKHRKRLLAKSRSGASIVEDVERIKQSFTNTTNGDWQVESTEPETKKPKLEETEKKSPKKTNKNENRRDKNTEKRKVASAVNGVFVKKRKINAGETGVDKAAIENTNVELKRVKKEKEMKHKTKRDVTTVLNGVADKNEGKVTVKQRNIEHKKVDKNINTQNNVEKVREAKKVDETNVNRVVQKERKENKPTFLVNKVKNFQKSTKTESSDKMSMSPKKVKFVLKNNCMQGPVDYYKSVRRSPSIPFDSSKIPSKTNLKPSTPSPINPFFKKKLRIKH